MEEQNEDSEEEKEPVNADDTIDALTAHFRRTSRGRIVDLPRWAQ
jgi:hypothetical protein